MTFKAHTDIKPTPVSEISEMVGKPFVVFEGKAFLVPENTTTSDFLKSLKGV